MVSRMQDVSIVATASILPETVVTNRDIGQRLIDGAHARNVRDADAEATARARSELIEQKTGLRARRFFNAEDTPVEIGTTLLEKLMGESDWAALDAVIVSSSSTQGFPGLSQQIVVTARERHGALAQKRETDYLRACWATAEHKEAVQAFLDKRPARFR